jgi:DNA topoisomerase-1
LEIVKTFEKYAPDILSEQLTRHFERDMELIRERKKSQEEVYSEAKKVLTNILNIFNLHKLEIGKELSATIVFEKKEKEVLMRCPKCGKGDFKVITSKKSGKRFLACSNYPSCKTAWPLPQKGLFKILKEKHSCGTPLIQIVKKGKKPWTLCPNPTCTKK